MYALFFEAILFSKNLVWWQIHIFKNIEYSLLSVFNTSITLKIESTIG